MKLLKAKEVVRMVEKIRAESGDDERAHSMEDTLYQSVLRCIADGTAENPAECAAEALKAAAISFQRWCA